MDNNNQQLNKTTMNTTTKQQTITDIENFIDKKLNERQYYTFIVNNDEKYKFRFESLFKELTQHFSEYQFPNLTSLEKEYYEILTNFCINTKYSPQTYLNDVNNLNNQFNSLFQKWREALNQDLKLLYDDENNN